VTIVVFRVCGVHTSTRSISADFQQKQQFCSHETGFQVVMRFIHLICQRRPLKWNTQLAKTGKRQTKNGWKQADYGEDVGDVDDGRPPPPTRRKMTQLAPNLLLSEVY